MGLMVRFPSLPEADASMMRVGRSQLYNLTVGAMQTFELRNQAISRTEAGEANVALAKQQMQLVLQERLSEARRAFVHAVYTQEKYVLLQLLAREAAQLSEVIQQRHKAGHSTGFDATLAALEANRTTIAVQQGQLQADQARQALTRLTYLEINPQQVFSLPSFPDTLLTEAHLIQKAWQNRAELMVLAQERNVLSAKRLLADKNQTPNLQAGAFVAIDNTYLDRTIPVVGLRFVMPLPIRKPGWYNLGTAELLRLDSELIANQFTYEAKKEQIRLEVIAAAAQLTLASRTYRLSQAMQELLAETTTQIAQLYHEKRLDVTQYLAHQTRLASVRLERLEWAYQVMLAYTEANIACGLPD
ncbi:MAG TPA: hypothetical protein DIW24_00980 [Bacteroidetes bacterium]|nr:hypothetical protein [Bacteroidota bacterium]